MKKYTCFVCGEHGCKLEVGDEAGSAPTACPYGFQKDMVRWILE